MDKSGRRGSFLGHLNNPHELFARYLLPVLSVFVAVQINRLLEPHVSVLPPFVFFLAATMVTAWYGGFRSATVAILLSAFTVNYYFIDPLHSFMVQPVEAGIIAFFVLEALGMAYCIDYLRKNEERLRRANMELEHRVASERRHLTEKEEKVRGLMAQLTTIEERERRLLAAELHDYLAQLLTLARIKSKQAQQCLYRSAGESNRYIQEADELLHKSLDYVRTLMAELYPRELHELGLPAALRRLAGQMRRHGLTVDLSLEHEFLSLPEDHAVLLYQSVRELLMNIVKHAAVDRALVSLRAGSDELLVTVKDAGRGFHASAPPPTPAGQHFGLSSVRERMDTIGGRFVLQSALEQGTTVILSVPLQPLPESDSLRAASSTQQDRVKALPTAPSNQEPLPF